MPNLEINIHDCWAKTDPITGCPVLTVRDHCLIVGFVAEVLSAFLEDSVQALLPAGHVPLAAAHDLGKLTPGFQLKASAWEYHDRVRQSVIHDGLATNHAIVSQHHLQSSESIRSNKACQYWLVSTGGHHGSYPFGLKRMTGRAPSEGGSGDFMPLRTELLNELLATFGSLPSDSAKGECERVHFMTGFTIFADWIASNTDWFPPNIQPDRKIIAAAAHRILTDLGWNSAIASGVSFGQQFLPEDPGSFQPRGIQSALLDMADAPGLYILEAPMGMGKTEAALATAYKRWTEGPERGLYFALPTQLTSNRIHDRISAFLRNTLENPAILTLAHGSAWLGERQARMLSPEDESDESNDTDEALRWYSSTRRALLAPFGTGTIDQALLAILPARFAALRYFGLTGKVVVIDEVHSYDPYMSALIDRLVNYLLKARSTVIVLSATLTAERRGELIAAAGAVESNPPLSYPLITKVGAGSKTAVHVPVDCDTPPKTIRLSHHTLYPETEDNFWCRVASQVEEGANIVILRNTVALAQQTFNRLKSFVTERISDHHVGLIHSRFPHWQRQENEEKWVRFLGKGDAQRPPGSLLVSTQIVEQSVDIDADILVTDLAPTDLILQRIGRLHRHSRSRASGFEHATCHILHPPTDWQGSERAVKEQLTPHHFIYPALTLWQASCHLRSRESIDLPDDVRQTLETASGLRPGHDSSPAVIAFYESFQRECDTQTGTAKTRDVFNQSAIDDKEGVETRYGVQPTARLVLIQSYPEERDGVITLKPYQGSPVRFNPAEFSSRLAETLHLNAARIPSYLVRNQLIHSPAWLKQHLSDAVLAIVSDDTSELGIVPDRPSPFVLYYHPTQGILYEKKADKVALAEPEDFWF